MRKTVVVDIEKDNQRCIERPTDMPLPERLAKEYNGLPFELFDDWIELQEEMQEAGLPEETVHTFEWDPDDFDEKGHRKVGSKFKKQQ